MYHSYDEYERLKDSYKSNKYKKNNNINEYYDKNHEDDLYLENNNIEENGNQYYDDEY